MLGLTTVAGASCWAVLAGNNYIITEWEHTHQFKACHDLSWTHCTTHCIGYEVAYVTVLYVSSWVLSENILTLTVIRQFKRLEDTDT